MPDILSSVLDDIGGQKLCVKVCVCLMKSVISLMLASFV
jgi:hypothetical protein